MSDISVYHSKYRNVTEMKKRIKSVRNIMFEEGGQI